jgi:hypothetical protein
LLDVTGSMSGWPKMILEKMPTLYIETNNAIQGITPAYAENHSNKLKEVLEISIIAIGDTRRDSYSSDKYPIQVTDFTNYGGLQEKIKEIYPEGGGGGNSCESYDMALYYVLNHCKVKDKNPILIIAEDERFYEDVDKDEIKRYIGDSIEERIKTQSIIDKLKQKFSTYVLKKEYGRGAEEQWREAMGKDRVIMMEDPKRLVDAAIVAAAHASGHLDVGLEWIERRQTKSQVEEVKNYFKNLIKSQKTQKRGGKKSVDDLLEDMHPFRRKK